MLLLDDLPHADEASASLLLGLADCLTDAPVVVVATLDPATLPRAVRAAHESRPRRDRHELQGLTLATVRRLAGVVLDAPVDADWLRSLHYYTEGMPEATLALLRALGNRADAPPAVPSLALPESLRAALHQRLDELDTRTRRLVLAATALPPSWTAAEVARVAGLDGDPAVDLDEAIASGWLRRDEAGRGFQVRSPFLRRVVADLLSPVRRHQLEQRAARPPGPHDHEGSHA